MVSYPGDWKKTTLEEEYLIIMGQSPASSSYNYSKNGLPLIQGNADIENGITSTQRYTSQPTKICDADSVIMSVRAPVGTVSRANQRVCLGRGVCAIVGKITNFVYYLMKYHEKSWQKLEQGSTFTAVSGKVIRDFEIVIPSDESEQIAIADTLATFDTHITNLTDLISKKKAIREGALDELMTGQTRLKGFCGDWEYFTIDDITDNIITGGTPSTTHSEYWGGTIPWLTSTEVHQKHITKPTTYITDIGFNNSSAKIAPGGSVIIALAGQGKTRGTAALLESSMALNQSLVALVTNDKCNNKFLFYLIENMYLALRKLSSGDGGRGGLSKKLIRNIKVHIPPINEQTAIADTLSALDKEISSLESERAKISQIRDGAMNDLLTGKVRLINGK